jgi:hypothetical protein
VVEVWRGYKALHQVVLKLGSMWAVSSGVAVICAKRAPSLKRQMT